MLIAELASLDFHLTIQEKIMVLGKAAPSSECPMTGLQVHGVGAGDRVWFVEPQVI